jgi:hypothetical protein
VIVEQDRLYRRRILEEVRPLGSRRSIYYGHVPPARDRQPSEGCPRAPLRASRGDRNNIPYSTTIFDNVVPIAYGDPFELILRYCLRGMMLINIKPLAAFKFLKGICLNY